MPKTSHAITSLSVSGFKSIVDEQTIQIRPLTLLAGANSSGKSSMIQPLLLLKQTLEAQYDPGPLLLNGPNVKFTAARQFLPVGLGTHNAATFVAELGTSNDTRFKVGFRWSSASKRLEVEFNNYEMNKSVITINRDTSTSELIELLRPRMGPDRVRELKNESVATALRLRQDRFLLELDHDEDEPGLFFLLAFELLRLQQDCARLILDVIHLPGLRGNPARTYSITAAGPAFPGTFESYVATLITHWSSDAPQRIKELSNDLGKLGLTWKIESKRIDDSQVELQVGRMPRPKRGASGDLVSIADVGFGVSQTLPVVVALRAAHPGQLIYIEQPEIHLHPRAQIGLAYLLVDAANRGVRVVAETHSSLLLLAVQTLVAEGQIDPSLVGLNWFLRSEKDGATHIKTADLDEAGRFGDWPEDFDEVSLKAEHDYLSAAESRLAKE